MASGEGIAGTLVVEKILGAAAETGADLETCLSLGAKVKARTRSMGVALSQLYVADPGLAHLLAGLRRDGVGGRHPWRARPPESQNGWRRRHRR